MLHKRWTQVKWFSWQVKSTVFRLIATLKLWRNELSSILRWISDQQRTKNKDNSNMRIEVVKINWLVTPWFANLPNIWRRQKSAKSCHNGQILQKSNSQSAEVCATKLIKNRWFFPVHESRRRQNDRSSLRVKKKIQVSITILAIFLWINLMLTVVYEQNKLNINEEQIK